MSAKNGIYERQRFPVISTLSISLSLSLSLSLSRRGRGIERGVKRDSGTERERRVCTIFPRFNDSTRCDLGRQVEEERMASAAAAEAATAAAAEKAEDGMRAASVRNRDSERIRAPDRK